PLEPLEILLRRPQARNPEHQAVAEEDLAERPPDDGGDAPAHKCLRRMLARRPAAEGLSNDQNERALVSRRGGRMLRAVLARGLDGVLVHRIERDFLQEPCRDEPVGVDVIAGYRNPTPHDLTTLVVHRGAHRRISLTSATVPLIAVAAAMA